MRRRARGATLVEILVSLAIVLIGMLALFRTLAVSVVGSGTSSRISQAQVRATAIMEAIRSAPKPALDCLATNPAPTWSACETTCLNNLSSTSSQPPTLKSQACIFTPTTLAVMPGPSAAGAVQLPLTDRAGQQYSLVYFATPETPQVDGVPRTSFVQKGGPGGVVYDIQVTLGWHDDGSAAVSNPAVGGDHFVTLRSAVAAF